MNTVFNRNWTLPFSTILRHRPWPRSSVIAPRLTTTELVEEEKTPYYRADRFYPARLGEILHGRYQIVTKVGYGSSSTVWLARDLHQCRWLGELFVAVKILSNWCVAKGDPGAELGILKHISTANPQHKGWHFVRRLVDNFEITGGNGKHVCLVFEPLREPLWLNRLRYIGETIPPEFLKVMVQMMLHGLDYLHSECRLIHTDLEMDNIMVRPEDPKIFERDAIDEWKNPLPQKHVEDRVIYLSRRDFGRALSPTGIVQIVDFDLAVQGGGLRFGCIQAERYRAPEVIMECGYTYSADIWNLGVVLWDALEGKCLFDTAVSKVTNEYDDYLHLVSISSLLGPRPVDLGMGRRGSNVFDSNGCLYRPHDASIELTFENSISKISGEEKVMFIKFVKRMLTWRPEDRSTARELLDDPWLYTDFPQD